jgi:hypothetical protein
LNVFNTGSTPAPAKVRQYKLRISHSKQRAISGKFLPDGFDGLGADVFLN